MRATFGRGYRFNTRLQSKRNAASQRIQQFIHIMLKNQPRKSVFFIQAILLGKALLSPQEFEKLPLAYQKIFIFNLGVNFLIRPPIY